MKIPIPVDHSRSSCVFRYLRNRPSSQDLDYFLNARRFGGQYEHVRDELRKLIEAVAKHLRYDPQWANDEVRVFLTLLDDPEIVFEQSKRQNIVLYREANVVIYAVKWEWVLARKLKRLQMVGQQARAEDWKDTIAITKLLYDAKGGKLSPSTLQLFDNPKKESPVAPKTIMDLRRLVLELHHVDSLPTAVWVFSSSTRLFDYKWNNGATITRDFWPAMRGRIPVYLADDQRWRYYDCDAEQWGGMLTSVAV